MDAHVIDCCSLINLLTGWRGLAELQPLGGTWHICEAVLGEAEYTREYDLHGAPEMVPIDMNALVRPGLLVAARPDTEEEVNDYVRFATEIDDGEAQALAIAKCRGFVLLTDDAKAVKIAQRPDVGVRTISTVDVLQEWVRSDPVNEGRLPEVIQRISVLARFLPRKESPEFAWWIRYLPTEK